MLFTTFVFIFLVIYLILKMVASVNNASSSLGNNRSKRKKEYYSYQKKILENLKKQYYRDEIDLPDQGKKISSDDPSDRETDIIGCYNDYYLKYEPVLRDIYSRANEVGKQIRSIYASSEADMDELAYLQAHEDSLKELCRQYDNILRETSMKTIYIDGKKTSRLSDLKDLFFQIDKSQKLSLDPSNSKLVVDRKLKEMMIFEALYDPVVIKIGSAYFCIYDDCILVFDYKGTFKDAYKRDALSITYTICSETVRAADGCANNVYTSSDSQLKKRLSYHSYWDYENKDGSPDRRRRDNRQHYRSENIYNYIKLKISIASYSLDVISSTGYVIESVKSMKL